MLSFSLNLHKNAIKALKKRLQVARNRGKLQEVIRIQALLSQADGKSVQEIAQTLRVSEESVRNWLKKYMVAGLDSIHSKKKSGRPPKLTKTQRRTLKHMIDGGPQAHGYPGACWCSSMVQDLINREFGVFYNVRYISQLLDALGFSYQKAKFVAANQDDDQRQKWLSETWPKIMAQGKENDAHILFGDEASFPQWGSLGYTWSRKGHQPVILTSGKRRSYKVFGLIDYFTGDFFSKGHEGKLNGEAYIAFLQEVLDKTNKQIILIQDNAPYHRSQAVQTFFEQHAGRITVYRLPTYSPDYNPIEKLWKKIKQKGIHLTFFPTFEALKRKVNKMLNIFSDAKKEVLSLFGAYMGLDITA